jgi:photosystem II stability/assembly factor-like uncharacterized protein
MQGEKAYDDSIGGEDLNAIACRYSGEAWIVGDLGTLLYTNNGGEDWEAQVLPTTRNLRTLATQDDGPVFVGGEGTFLVTKDTGTTWIDLGDGTTSFRSMSAAYANSGVLALAEDGGLWEYEAGALTKKLTLAGARAIHQTEGGDVIMAVGNGIMKSINGGATFEPLVVDPSITFNDIRVNADGSAVAVGAGGAIANIDAAGTVAVQYVGASDLHTIHIHHDLNGYAGGDDGTVLMTHDLGLTWQVVANVGRTVRGVDEIGPGHR